MFFLLLGSLRILGFTFYLPSFVRNPSFLKTLPLVLSEMVEIVVKYSICWWEFPHSVVQRPVLDPHYYESSNGGKYLVLLPKFCESCVEHNKDRIQNNDIYAGFVILYHLLGIGEAEVVGFFFSSSYWQANLPLLARLRQFLGVCAVRVTKFTDGLMPFMQREQTCADQNGLINVNFDAKIHHCVIHW